MPGDATPHDGAGEVLLLTADAALRDDVARLAAAVGVGVRQADDAGSAGRRWLDTPLVLLGPDAAALGTPVRRGGVVLVAPSGSGERVWRLGMQVGAEAVAVLPQDEAWLLERLTAVADGARTRGQVVGVVGGRGGAGASTLAAGLAVTAARDGGDVLLVDGDPAGGGLDLLMGMESEPGLRWPDLQEVRGALRAGVLRDGLPRLGGVGLLSWGRSLPGVLPPSAMEAVLDAARRSHHLVVVDLPRHEDPATAAALWRLDLLVVVVPAEVRAAAAAAHLVERAGPYVGALRLVVRGPAPTGLPAEAVADTVGLPLSERWADDPSVAADADRGRAPATRTRTGLARLCTRLLADLADDQAAAPVGALVDAATPPWPAGRTGATA